MRFGGDAAAVHLGWISDELHTSFPSQVSVFFTTTAVVELVQMKELEFLPEPKLYGEVHRPYLRPGLSPDE